MRVLVTGAAGFVGAHSVRRLRDDGHHVVGVDSFSDFHPRELKEMRWKALVGGEVPLVEGDIAEQGLVGELVAQHEVDTVLHLAAQAGIRFARRHARRTVLTNILGTHEVFEAARQHGVQRLVYASSSSVYGQHLGICREDDLAVWPTSLYGATKRCNEVEALAAWGSDSQPSVGARFFTAYGPWGRPDMAYFRLLGAAFFQRTFTLMADQDVVRDFTYIDDLVDSIVSLLSLAGEFGSPATVVNIGGGHPCTLADMIAAVEEVVGRPVRVEVGDTTPGDVTRTEASIDRLRDFELPVPRTMLLDGISSTFEWMKSVKPKVEAWLDYSAD